MRALITFAAMIQPPLPPRPPLAARPAGGERHASLVVRQNHDPNGQCRGEPGNEIHRRAAAFARRPKLYIPITIKTQINLVPLMCLSGQGSNEHFRNFDKKS